MSNHPVEFLEANNPIRVEDYGFVPDTGGAGRNVGAQAIRRTYLFLLEEGYVLMRSDRRRLGGAYGVGGGKAGAPSATIVNPGPNQVELPGIARHPLRHGDTVSHRSCGGGGYGNPFERDVRAVLDDVREGRCSVERALRDFGVEVDPVASTARRIRTSPA